MLSAMEIEKQDVKNGLIKKIQEGVPTASVQEIENYINEKAESIGKMSESVVIPVIIGQLKQSIKLADMDSKRAYYLGSVDDWAQFNKMNTHHIFLQEDNKFWESTLFGSKPKGVVTELRPLYKYNIKVSQQESQKGNKFEVIEDYSQLKDELLDFDSLQETDLNSLPDLYKKTYIIVLTGSFYQVTPFKRSTYNNETESWDEDPNLYPGLYEGQILFQSKFNKKRFYITVVCSLQKTGLRLFLPQGEDLESLKFLLQSNPANEQEYKRLNPSFNGKYDTIHNNELIERQIKVLGEALNGFTFKAIGRGYFRESQSYQTRDDWEGNIVNVNFTPTIMKLIPKSSYKSSEKAPVVVTDGSLEGFEEFYKALVLGGKENIYPAIQPLKDTGLFEQLSTNGFIIKKGEQLDVWNFLQDWDKAKPVFENYWKIKTAQENSLEPLMAQTGKSKAEIQELIDKKQYDSGNTISKKAAFILVKKDLLSNKIVKVTRTNPQTGESFVDTYDDFNGSCMSCQRGGSDRPISGGSAQCQECDDNDYKGLVWDGQKYIPKQNNNLEQQIQAKITEIKTALPTIDNKSLAEAVAKQFNLQSDQILKMLSKDKKLIKEDGTEVISKDGTDFNKTVENLLHNPIITGKDGIEFSDLLAKVLETFPNTTESTLDDTLFELAYEGKVFQPRPNIYKIMD